MNMENPWYGPACYRIKVKGRLGGHWDDWFEEMTISYEKGVTTISGKVVDQAALHGILNRVRDLGLQLISVKRVESGTSGKHNSE